MKIAFFLASLPEDRLAERQFPLGAGYIASYLRQQLSGVEVAIAATTAEILDVEPDIVGISSTSQCFAYAASAARLFRERLGVPIVLGGYHITPLPHSLPVWADVGVIGEGEESMVELADLYQRHRYRSLPPEKLGRVAGICFRNRRDDVVVNPRRPEMENIDCLPFPQRNISRGARNIAMFSSRGCVYKCKYCASARFWRRFRVHSASYFVAELKQLIRHYDATSVYLLDDLFFAKKGRVSEIVHIMEREGLLGRLSFHGFISSNLAQPDLLDAAVRMGFKSIRFGAETGSDQLLKAMKGPHAAVDNHQRCVDLCYERGLEVRAAFMLGTPGETVVDLDRTYEFLAKNRDRLLIDGFYLTTPVPGTPYWDLALARGLVSEEMDWQRLNLDLLKQESFDPSRALYLNADHVSLETTLTYGRRFVDEFQFHQLREAR
ncbi:B12-binding domain-containing radical SAM protein [Planctomycetota bacterium]